MQAKEDQLASIQSVFSQLPNDLSREMFTERILQIILQLKKQQADIDKILLEVFALPF